MKNSRLNGEFRNFLGKRRVVDLRRVEGSWKKFERVKGGKNGRNLMRVGVM